MKVKKFVAESMPEAMQLIRDELGEEAVILNSKEVKKGGFFGLFVKTGIEVIAAVDQSSMKRAKRHHFKENDQKFVEHFEEFKSELVQIVKNKSRTNTQFSELEHLLVQHEISPTLLQKMMRALNQRYKQQEYKDIPFAIQKEWVQKFLYSLIQSVTIGGFNYEKQFLNIVGPTGVGKTTTIAKIAAKSVLKDKKKVALITTDTYRIAAIEQLKTYAKLLSIPVEVVYNDKDFHSAKEKFRSYDLIITDSAGRNFREPRFVHELRETIPFNEEMETYLVLALTSKYADCQKVIEQFHGLGINQVIFTKKDETSSYGNIFNVMNDYSLGIAYITDGQNVPEDIVEVSEDYLLQCLFEVEAYV